MVFCASGGLLLGRADDVEKLPDGFAGRAGVVDGVIRLEFDEGVVALEPLVKRAVAAARAAAQPGR